MKILIIIGLFFLIGCSTRYSVETTNICTNPKSAFICKKIDSGGSYSETNLAICETEKECRNICNRYRGGE